MGAFQLWGASISASLHTCFRKKKNAMKDLLKASISVKVLGIKYTEDPVGLPTYKESGQYSGCKSLLPCNK
jgi:hypothetical protein